MGDWKAGERQNLGIFPSPSSLLLRKHLQHERNLLHGFSSYGNRLLKVPASALGSDNPISFLCLASPGGSSGFLLLHKLWVASPFPVKLLNFSITHVINSLIKFPLF